MPTMPSFYTHYFYTIAYIILCFFLHHFPSLCLRPLKLELVAAEKKTQNLKKKFLLPRIGGDVLAPISNFLTVNLMFVLIVTSKRQQRHCVGLSDVYVCTILYVLGTKAGKKMKKNGEKLLYKNGEEQNDPHGLNRIVNALRITF